MISVKIVPFDTGRDSPSRYMVYIFVGDRGFGHEVLHWSSAIIAAKEAAAALDIPESEITYWTREGYVSLSEVTSSAETAP